MAEVRFSNLNFLDNEYNINVDACNTLRKTLELDENEETFTFR